MKNRARSRATLFATAMAAAPLAWAGPALAQSTTAADAGTRAEASTNLDEIIVTAQRRAERLVDVGVTVSVLSGEQVRAQRIEQVRDIVVATPNMNIKEPFPGLFPVVTIRGVGLDDYGINNGPSAGVYIDEIPLTTLVLMNAEYFDQERLEVLKGPQGTLYGSNSTAGAINIISARPTDWFEGRVAVGYGNYDRFDAEGMVNLPISPTVMLRLAGKTVQQYDGWWTNVLRPGKHNLGERHIWAGRAQLLFEPSDTFEWLFKVEAQRARAEAGQVEGCGPVYCDPTDPPGVDGGNPYLGAWDGPARNGRFPFESDSFNATSKIVGDLGFADVIAITGYMKLDRDYLNDGDGGPFDAFQGPRAEGVEQFTQEFRLEKTGPVFDWLVGGFFSWDTIYQDNRPRAAAIGRRLFGVEIQQVGKFEQDSHAEALFANGGWRINDKLKLTAGVRHNWLYRKFAGGSDWTPAIGPFQDALTTINHRESTWSFKGQLEYKPTDESLLYASISQGTKSGGVFGGTVTSVTQIRSYRPEKLLAYEVGGKIQSRKVSLNVAAFYYDSTDLQAVQRVPTVSGATIANIPKAKLYGVDFEGTIRPVEGLSLSANAGYLHSRLSAFGAPPVSIPAGNRAPNAPEWTFGGSAAYEFDLGPLRSSVRGNIRYEDGQFKDATNALVGLTPATTIVDARVAVWKEGRPWEIAGWVKNLTNEIKFVSVVDARSLGILDRVYTAPRTYGVTLSYRFGQ